MTPPVAPIEGAESREAVERMARSPRRWEGMDPYMVMADRERAHKVILDAQHDIALLLLRVTTLTAQLAAAQLAAQGAREAASYERGVKDTLAIVERRSGKHRDWSFAARKAEALRAEILRLLPVTPVDSSPDTSAGEMT